MKTTKPDTVLYRAPTFSLLLVSHGRITHVLNPIFIKVLYYSDLETHQNLTSINFGDQR